MHSHALFLCYPPPDSNMAEAAVAKYAGDTVLYVGEWDGDTGTASLQHRLLRHWHLDEVVPLPNWGDTCYELMVWKRGDRKAGSTGHRRGPTGARQPLETTSSTIDYSSGRQVSELMPLGVLCATCGAHGTQHSPLWRCRQTCCFAFCSDKCLQLSLRAENAELCTASGGQQAGHKLQPLGAGCSSACRQGHGPGLRHSDLLSMPVRLGSYAGELGMRHCTVEAGALQLSDSRLYRPWTHDPRPADNEQRAAHDACHEKAGSSKKRSRKKQRKR